MIRLPRSRRARTTSSWFAMIAAYAVLGLILVGCREKRNVAAPGDSFELRYEGSPGTVTLPELAEDLGQLGRIKLSYADSTTSGPQSIQMVVTGDTDVGGAFNGAILKLVAARAPIRALVGLYGVDEEVWNGFYVAADSPIRTARDLIGKKVAMNTIGAHHEFVLREYLSRNGLSPDEGKQVMLVVIPPVNGEQALRQHQVDVSVLGGVFRDRALERGGLRLLFSDRDLFGSFTAGSYVMRTDFIEKHPDVVKDFVAGVGQALEWSRTTPREEVRDRLRRIIERRHRNEDTSLLKYWLGYGVTNRGGVLQGREFELWRDWLVRVGELQPGQVDVNRVYTNAFNPLASGEAQEPKRTVL